MPAGAEDRGAELEHFRQDLKQMAQQQLDRCLWDKVDLSGIVQETLLEAFQAGDQFQRLSEAEKRPWLRRVLANNLKDALARLRTRKRDVQRELSLDAALDASSARLEVWLASEENSPSQQAIRNEEALRLQAALARLSADRRRVVELHLQGHRLEEIAQVMGKRKSAVAQLLHRGIQDLHHLLAPE
jgi:RNA polymerase sigma-70 factor (subfamily 1)